MLQHMEETSMNPIPRQTWRELYKTALAETNHVESRRKIDLACTAILQRIDELAGARDNSAIQEQLEILDSLRKLRTIQRQGSVDATPSGECVAQESAL